MTEKASPMPLSDDHDGSLLPPLEELTVRGDKLLHIAGGSLTSEILDTRRIEIAAKSDVVDLAGDDVAFLFRLNHIADHVWAHQFTSHVGDMRADVHGAQLEIHCLPTDLGRTYAAVKSALARTNDGYATYRSRVCELVAQSETKRAGDAAAAAKKSAAARAAWERLEL